jgi:hypothetical protein
VCFGEELYAASASGAVSVTNASIGFLRNTLRLSSDDVLMTLALAVSVGSLDSGVHRRVSLVYAGLPPFYLLVSDMFSSRLVTMVVFWQALVKTSV